MHSVNPAHMQYSNQNSGLAFLTSTLTAVTDIITKRISCRGMWAIGFTQEALVTYSIFDPEGAPDTGHNLLHLVVVVDDTVNRIVQEIQDLLENACSQVCDTFIMAFHQKNFLQLHASTPGFTKAIITTGISKMRHDPLLEALQQLEPAPEVHEPRMSAVNAAEAYLSGALFFLQGRHHGLATFMLHQAVEILLVAMFRDKTGYSFVTHNLDRLRKACRMLDPRIHTIFPVDSAKEQELFTTIKRAYVNGRYDSDFLPAREDIKTLVERVQMLLALYINKTRTAATSK